MYLRYSVMSSFFSTEHWSRKLRKLTRRSRPVGYGMKCHFRYLDDDPSLLFMWFYPYGRTFLYDGKVNMLSFTPRRNSDRPGLLVSVKMNGLSVCLSTQDPDSWYGYSGLTTAFPNLMPSAKTSTIETADVPDECSFTMT